MGIDDEEFAAADQQRCEAEWGSEHERRCEEQGRYEQALHSRQLTVFGVWPETGELPEQARERWARALCRQHEEGGGPGLEVLLGLVPEGCDLEAAPLRVGHIATWNDGANEVATASGPTREAAIRAATLELLGLDPATAGPQLLGSPARVVRAAMALVDQIRTGAEGYGDEPSRSEAELVAAVEELRRGTGEPRQTCGTGEPRQTCGTCDHWQREGEPATSEGARLCRLRPDVAARTGDSSCERWEGLPEQIGAGVTQLANVVRAEEGES